MNSSWREYSEGGLSGGRSLANDVLPVYKGRKASPPRAVVSSSGQVDSLALWANDIEKPALAPMNAAIQKVAPLFAPPPDGTGSMGRGVWLGEYTRQ